MIAKMIRGEMDVRASSRLRTTTIFVASVRAKRDECEADREPRRFLRERLATRQLGSAIVLVRSRSPRFADGLTKAVNNKLSLVVLFELCVISMYSRGR
jgi:hypothetical protein